MIKIKIYCDMCGKPIDHNIDGVNLDFFNARNQCFDILLQLFHIGQFFTE